MKSPPRSAPLASSKFRADKDLIGLSWAYRFEIKAGFGLPLTCASAYCQYDLLGETFTTDTVQPDPPSPSPVLNYSFVHRVDKVCLWCAGGAALQLFNGINRQIINLVIREREGKRTAALFVVNLIV